MANSGSTVEIILANGRGVAVIDADDAARIPLTGWHRHNGGYAQHRWRTGAGRHTHVLLHRLIMGNPIGKEIDHINHDKLDCRKANLRSVAKFQNAQNLKGALRTNALGLRGVIAYDTKAGPRYRAAVQLLGRTFYKYGFKSAEEASTSAAAMRTELFEIPGGSR